jgi:hypothetical protein
MYVKFAVSRRCKVSKTCHVANRQDPGDAAVVGHVLHERNSGTSTEIKHQRSVIQTEAEIWQAGPKRRRVNYYELQLCTVQNAPLVDAKVQKNLLRVHDELMEQSAGSA